MENSNQIKTGKKKKPTISLLKLLATQKPADSRKILAKHGKADATDYNDLELKLADLYANSPDKLTIEKEFAEIHPHKSFILRNLKPIEPTPTAETNKEIPTENSSMDMKQKMRKFVESSDDYYNCGGNSRCGCNSNFSNACGCGSSNFSNACGCGGSSNFSSGSNRTGPNNNEPFGKNLIDWVGPVAIIFTIGMITYSITKIKN